MKETYTVHTFCESLVCTAHGFGGVEIGLIDTLRVRGPGTLAFRLFSDLETIQASAGELLTALRETKDIATIDKGPVMEFLMQTAEQEKMDELRDLSASALREWALREGERRGEARGRITTLLHVAQRILPADQLQGLLEIKDPDVLEAELFRRAGTP